MAKKIISLLLWLLAAALLHLFGNNAGTFAILIASIAMPTLSFLVLLVVSWRLGAVTLSIPHSCTKGEEITGNFTFKHSRLLKAYFTLICENRFTGEFEASRLNIHQHGNQFVIQTPHCGVLQICIDEITILDPLGLFARKIKTDEKQYIIVSPKGYTMDIAFQDSAFDPESNDYSTTKPGYDVSEIFAIREYTPGDPIRSIHWKLSEKQDKTMVREFGLPISNSTLLFLENAHEEISPAGWDATAEMFYSAMLALLENDTAVTAVWQKVNGNLSQFEICTFEDAIFAIGECFLTAMRYGAPIRDLLPTGFANIMEITPNNTHG